MSVEHSTPSCKDAGFNQDYGYRKLSKEEELRYFDLYHQGDKEAFDILVKSQIPFAISIAVRLGKKWKARINISDLKQEAFIGLIKAIEKFDISHGTRLNTFAGRVIQNTLFNYIASYDIIRIPTYLATGHPEVHKPKAVCETQLAAAERREPYIEDVRRNIDEPDFSLHLDVLTDRQCYIIMQLFYAEQTLKAVGQALDISKQRVEQIRNEALEVLRRVHCKN